MQHNKFQPLQEERIQGSRDNDRVREGYADANNSKGSCTRDPIYLPPEILAMLDMHEPDKTKQAKLLTEHLSGQRVMPSTEEELQQHLERKAKREAKRQLAAAEAEAHRLEQAKQAEVAQQAKSEGVIATFAKRAKEAALATRATPKDAEIQRQQQTPQQHLRMLQLCRNRQLQFEQTTDYRQFTNAAAEQLITSWRELQCKGE
jgi:hypothetical protein